MLAAGLTWREVAILRAYAHYLRQIGTPYTERYVEQVLSSHPAITADLAALFGVQFDPDRFPDDADGRDARQAHAGRITESVTAALDAVTSLDADRILRTLLAVIAGQCAYGDRSAPALGATLEERARATYHPADCACHERRPASLLHRLRAAFAA